MNQDALLPRGPYGEQNQWQLKIEQVYHSNLDKALSKNYDGDFRSMAPNHCVSMEVRL